MCDYAEGKLFQHIKEGNVSSLIFYLKTRHPEYSPKFKFRGEIKREEKELSDEDKELIRTTLKRSGAFSRSAEVQI